eukprot:14721539-Alexandrium_andersonii.AAC.1
MALFVLLSLASLGWACCCGPVPQCRIGEASKPGPSPIDGADDANSAPSSRAGVFIESINVTSLAPHTHELLARIAGSAEGQQVDVVCIQEHCVPVARQPS